MKAVGALPGYLPPGTMMVQNGLLVPNMVNMETDAYSKGWQSVRAIGNAALGDRLRAVGWHLFFIAGDVSTIAFGRGGERSLRRAVQRIAARVRELNFNCLELTGIVRKRLLGIPYVLVSANSCHIQQDWLLQNSDVRARLQRDGDWARK